MQRFTRAAALLVFTLAALAFAGVASAATSYSFFHTGQIIMPGEASARAAQASTDGTSDGGVDFGVPAGLTVGDLTNLATDYGFTVGSCGAGAPRFAVGITDGTSSGNLNFYLGPLPNYMGCASGWTPSGNLAAPANLVDASQVGGTFYEPYELVQTTFGDWHVTSISLVVDSGNGAPQTVRFDDTQINGDTVTYDCMQTGFVRDNMNLTAAQMGGTVTGSLDATGCNIGAYNPDSVDGADISGANYFGVVENDHAGSVNGATIHSIGETPFNGTQHGVAVYYTGVGATGTIAGNTISSYQKGGVVVTNDASATLQDNTVTGLGGVDFIAQNGIQISDGATAQLTGNDVSANDYTPPKVTACGLLLSLAGGVGTKSIGALKQANNFHDDENDVCNFGKG